MKSLKGTGVALVTPFLADGAIDWAGLEAVINHCIEGGVEYLISLGTTGESVTLTDAEQNAVLDFTVRVVAGRVGLIAGFGGNNTQAVIERIRQRDFTGIDAILSVSPYYNKPTQEGIFRHYMAIAEASPRPIVIYNVPGRTGANVKAETTLRLAKANPKFIAVKEASGDLRQCMELVQGRPEGFVVLSGDDNLVLPQMACGMDGVISVIANAYPRRFSDLVRAGLAGDFAKARALHYQLIKLVDLLFVEGNPGGVKAALEVLGICKNELRLPLAPVSAATYAAIEAQVTALGKA